MAFTTQRGYAEPSQHILEIPRQGIFPFYTMVDFISILEPKKDHSYPDLKNVREHGSFYPFYIH